MKPVHGRLVQWLGASAIMAFALFVLYQKDIHEYRYPPLDQSHKDWVGGRPAGEIVQGFKLSQLLDVTVTHQHERDFVDAFCIQLLMANYANRRNRGTFAVSVTAGDAQQVKTVNARKINDNQFENICFEDMRVEQIYRKPATLEITGVDGKPGRSVTAWLSSTPVGNRAQVNGVETDLTLVHNIVLLKDTQHYQYNAYFLMLFASLIVGLILTALRNPDTV